MNIILREVETPQVTSFTLFGEPDLELLMRTKRVRIGTHLKTKTRISTSLQFGQFRNKINFAIDGYKTHLSREFSFVSGRHTESNYFVVSKKQNLEAYKEYVKKLVALVIKDYFKMELDEITIELEVTAFNK